MISHKRMSKFATYCFHEPLELRHGLLDLKPELALWQIVVGLVLEHVHGLNEQFSRLEQGLPKFLCGHLAGLPGPLPVLQLGGQGWKRVSVKLCQRLRISDTNQRQVELVEGNGRVDLRG